MEKLTLTSASFPTVGIPGCGVFLRIHKTTFKSTKGKQKAKSNKSGTCQRSQECPLLVVSFSYSQRATCCHCNALLTSWAWASLGLFTTILPVPRTNKLLFAKKKKKTLFLIRKCKLQKIIPMFSFQKLCTMKCLMRIWGR